MLSHSGLPKSLWPEAVNTAIYVLNRCLGPRDPNKTPYELWFGKKPNANNLHRFGQDAVVKYRDFERSKWDDKGVVQTFVGYTDTSNTFRFYDHNTGQVYTSCDAEFIDSSRKETERSETQNDLIVQQSSMNTNRQIAPDNQDLQNLEDNQQGDITIAELSWDMEPSSFGQPQDGDETFMSDQAPSDHFETNLQQPNQLVPTGAQSVQRSGRTDQPVAESTSRIETERTRKYDRKDKLKTITEKLKPSSICLCDHTF